MNNERALRKSNELSTQQRWNFHLTFQTTFKFFFILHPHTSGESYHLMKENCFALFASHKRSLFLVSVLSVELSTKDLRQNVPTEGGRILVGIMQQ